MDVRAVETGITGAIHLLMMGAGDNSGQVQDFDKLNELAISDFGVLFDDGKLIRGQRPRFIKEFGGYEHFPKVVVKGHLFDDGDFIGRVAHLFCELATDFGNGAAVLKLDAVLE